MRTRFILLASSVVTLCAASAASAADFPTASLPKQADAVEKFCPPHWKFETKIPCNLNQDSDMDLVASLISDEVKSKDDSPARQDRVLLVLLGRPGKKYELVEASTKFLLCTTCGGQLGANVDISAGKNSFKVDQSGGGGVDGFDDNYEFKYDSATHKCVVYHAELSADSDRNDSVGKSITIDFGNNTAVIDHYSGDKHKKQTQKFAPTKVYLSAIELGKSDVDKQLHLKW